MSEATPLERYNDRIAQLRLVPLWERLKQLLPPEPIVRAQPYLWNYAGLRPTLLESATLIAAEEAERRVLILENPGLVGESAATDDLFAGLQLIMPGEIAPSHRHTPAALRFIFESEKAYTSVDGERVDMHPGDLILTPSWRWHDHYHEGNDPVVWLDVLDLPLVRAMGPRFAEHHPLTRAPDGPPAEHSQYSFGHNMAPAMRAGTQSLLRYPFDPSREALEHMKNHSEWDDCHGVKLEYIDPTTGGSVMPTISAFLQLLPKGFSSKPYQTTAGTIYCVVSGRGSIHFGEPDNRALDFGPNDIFVVPCWREHKFAADEETVLFSASDRAVQNKLGLWREARGSNN
jgi:gentisate 1,2-dioxygenase